MTLQLHRQEVQERVSALETRVRAAKRVVAAQQEAAALLATLPAVAAAAGKKTKI